MLLNLHRSPSASLVSAIPYSFDPFRLRCPSEDRPLADHGGCLLYSSLVYPELISTLLEVSPEAFVYSLTNRKILAGRELLNVELTPMQVRRSGGCAWPLITSV